MRGLLPLITLGALASCGQASPKDCDTLKDELYDCLDQKDEAGQRNVGMVYDKCMPMSEPQLFVGIWATDFEFNEFYEGDAVLPQSVWQLPKLSTKLWGDNLNEYHDGTNAYVVELEFVGRKPVCNFTEPVRDIVVDEVIKSRILDRKPYLYSSTIESEADTQP